MERIDLSAGTVEYLDTGGAGPVLVFVHGLTMDGTVWRKVVDALVPDFRCILPTLPLGSHRIPMRADADLSLRAMGLLVGEFVAALDLREVTLVQNDWGGVQVLIAHGDTSRLAGVVLTPSEAFDNYPPGLPGRAVAVAVALPGGARALMWSLKFRAMRRAPGGWGWMSKRPIPDEVMDGWFRPATEDPLIRRDLVKYARSVPADATLLRWAEANRAFDRPVRVLWATEDRVMPREHGRRLAELYPRGELHEVDDSYTLVPEDCPEAIVSAIRDFVPLRRA
ncbi:alpha/beta hydrolase [Rhodococcus triatomae]|uniref:Pimeloyl-ACP methyl ester carboxylesterase n=1 Tax=Rhodococcus triatomae TaxID=300028 RepID=A0A1G8GPV8_9NOCA|nr:alpha/beta hydrolase [Rhodococcus triatomae]QNG20326.1 alpha/beta hydrolase [Rhodococcus triatomae]QNG23758.1 alpha/beta hydrolase [Rhodococcus triatomae]SDH96455.1 Pimeloyl-ACP methyl ester carboxylesterase [Rhodococcus triatomae]